MKTIAQKEQSFDRAEQKVLRLATVYHHVVGKAYIQSVADPLRPFSRTVREKRFQNIAQSGQRCYSYSRHQTTQSKMRSNERSKANSQQVIERERRKGRKKEVWRVLGSIHYNCPGVWRGQNYTERAWLGTHFDIEPMPLPLETKAGFTTGGR